jgi:hypothetical protein
MVMPRMGSWLSNPVSCPPNTGATAAIVVVTVPAISIRAGRSHLGGARTRRTGPAPRGQNRTINPIPPSATTAPATGGSATHSTKANIPR